MGSGFGGTILALSLANKFEDDNAKNNTNKRVCVFERGQWWLSHEMNFVPKASRKTSPNKFSLLYRFIQACPVFEGAQTVPRVFSRAAPNAKQLV